MLNTVLLCAVPCSPGSCSVRYSSSSLGTLITCVMHKAPYGQLKKNSSKKRLCMCSVAKSCLALCNLMDCSAPGSSVRGIFQARKLECVAIAFSRRSSQPRDRTHISCLAGGFFTTVPSGKPKEEVRPYYLDSILSPPAPPRTPVGFASDIHAVDFQHAVPNSLSLPLQWWPPVLTNRV